MKIEFGMPTNARFYVRRLLAECEIAGPPVSDERIGDYLGVSTRFYSQREHDAFLSGGREALHTSAAVSRPTLFDTSPYARPRPALSRRREGIDALLIRRGGERTIWLNADNPSRRRRSKRCHEFGHDYLPWHQDVSYGLDTCRFNVRTIDPWEREASQFGADLLMWPGWFLNDLVDVPMGFSGLSMLVDRYDTSLEATAIHYVRHHPGRCLLLVCELGWDEEENVPLMLVRYSIKSEEFPYFVALGTVLTTDSPVGACALTGEPQSGPVQGTMVGLSTHARYEIECRPWGSDGDVIALVWQRPARQGNLFQKSEA
jgi:hypothetical protein